MTEAWERFAFYGMQSLLVLYMGQVLADPARTGGVAGLATLRGVLQGLYGTLSPAALGSAIFGLYAGCIYLMPLAGGLLADRVAGRTRIVAAGALLMAAGYFLMAVPACFLLGLVSLLAGIGCFKGNLAVQLGEIYAAGDGRRTDAFQIYLLGINLAAIAAPLVCGTLGEQVDWAWGFAAAGAAMLAGLLTYLLGRGALAPPVSAGVVRRVRDGSPWRRQTLLLVVLLVALSLSEIGNLEIFNTYIVWGARHFDLTVFGWRMPAAWLVSLDSGLTACVLGASLLVWKWLGRRGFRLSDIAKLQFGMAVAAMAPLVLALASVIEARGGGKIALYWAVAFHVVNSIGIAHVFPTGLAVFTRVAPAALKGLATSLFFLHLSAANMIVGWLGGKIEVLGAAEFWLVHSAVIGMAFGLTLLSRFAFGEVLRTCP